MAFEVEESGDLDLLFEGTVDKAELFLKKVAMELFKSVILKTPVDTGRARANWTCTISEPSTERVYSKTDKQGSQTVALAIKKADKAQLGSNIYLSNNLPYIGVLEYGSSDQAPKGMVRISMQEIKNDMKDML